jgi:hypothetical protein
MEPLRSLLLGIDSYLVFGKNSLAIISCAQPAFTSIKGDSCKDIVRESEKDRVAIERMHLT